MSDRAEAQGTQLQRISLAFLRSALVGAALGTIAALLYVGLDPHLRIRFGLSLARSAPRMACAFAAASVFVTALALVPTGRLPDAWRGRLQAVLAAAIPGAGFATVVLLSPATPLTLTPKRTGLLVTTSEIAYAVALAALAIAAAWPLARWLRGEMERGWPGGSWRAASGAVAVSTLLAAGSLHGATPPVDGEKPKTEVRSLALIGIDGADWRQIRPLIASGKLPTLQRLVETGASGELTTYRPTLSPMIWTTVATGQPPDRHGILDFLHPTSKVPYTSNTRLTPALWNLLGDRGIPVGVAGWWVTWPAERVAGHMVSSYSSVGQGTIKPTLHQDLPRQTHPPELMDALRPGIASARDAAQTEVDAAVHGYRPSPRDAAYPKRVEQAAWVLAADRIFAEAAVRLAAQHRPRFLAAYLSAPDTVAHVFCDQNPWRASICERVVEPAYVSADRRLGEILAALGTDAHVVVVSDHGFDLDRGHHHAPPGIVILQGDGVRQGAQIEAASIYDIAPTVLALFGLPVPIDFRGRVLLGAFEPELASRIALTSGPALPRADADDEAAQPIASPSDSDMRDRLRALGYIE